MSGAPRGGTPPERPGPPARGPRTADAFTEVFGRPPAGVWAAPGRVNLIGEHTDYNDGLVLPLALPHRVEAAVFPRPDGRLRFHSGAAANPVRELETAALAPGAVPGWAAYPAGVFWALREAGHGVGGADVHLESDVPAGAGLSSSAALECSVAFALNDLHGLGLAPDALARTAQRAENAFVGVPCGVMDQMASSCCTEGHALRLDTRDLTQRQVPFDPAAEGLRLLVVDTRVAHALADGAYAALRRGCEAAADALGLPALRDLDPGGLGTALGALNRALGRAAGEEAGRLVRHVVTENHRVDAVAARLGAGDLRAVGPLLTGGHASLRDDLRVSCAELDLAVDTALAAGALGARMTGGGFGGSAVVLVEEDGADTVAGEILAAFTRSGHRPPGVFTAVPSPGARRVA